MLDGRRRAALFARALIAAALLAAGALTFGAAGAQAHEIACEFNGLAGTADPDGAGTGVWSIQTDIAQSGVSAFLTSVDTGNYTLSGPAMCLVREPPAPAPTVELANITSTGDYRNQVCGTGTAESTAGQVGDADADATVIDFVNPMRDDVTAVRYVVNFVAGNGTLTITGSAGGHPVAGNGAVQIHPIVGNCVNTDVQQWAVTSAFELSGP